jgi:DNA polymerase V
LTTLVVYVKTNRFKEGFYQESQVVNLPQGVKDDANLIKACTSALKKIYRPNLLYKKAGVMALDLTPNAQHQYSLFASDTIATPQTEKLLQAVDQINKKYGTGTIHRAACGTKLGWKDRKEFKSPSYTTCWQELPLVHAK